VACRRKHTLAKLGRDRVWSPAMRPPLVLYQRDYCHLCDQALAVMAQACAPDFDSVWVDDDEGLEARYGTRVPVLRDNRDGRELDWPFDAEAVRQFLTETL
jgi:hypothetical protein